MQHRPIGGLTLAAACSGQGGDRKVAHLEVVGVRRMALFEPPADVHLVDPNRLVDPPDHVRNETTRLLGFAGPFGIRALLRKAAIFVGSRDATIAGRVGRRGRCLLIEALRARRPIEGSIRAPLSSGLGQESELDRSSVPGRARLPTHLFGADRVDAISCLGIVLDHVGELVLEELSVCVTNMISSRNRHRGKRSAADLPPDTEHDDRDERKPANGREDLQRGVFLSGTKTGG